MTADTAPTPIQSAPHDEVLVPYLIALFSFCLALGLLLAASIAPLTWLPGQLPLLVAVCYLAPLCAVFSRRYQSRLDGLAAREYGRRALLLSMAVALLVLAGLPWLEWTHLLHGHGDWRGPAFGAPVIISLGVAALAWTHAAGVFDHWNILHTQPWEDGAAAPAPRGRGFDQQSGGRVDRTREIRILWRDYAGWGVVLSVALFFAGIWTFGGSQPAPVVSGLLLAGYGITGMLVIGRSAFLRLATEWQLDRLPIKGSVGRSWVPTTTTMVLGTALLIGLLLLAHVLDLVHIVAAAVWTAVLAPVLIALITFLVPTWPKSTMMHTMGTIGTFGHTGQLRTGDHHLTAQNPFSWLTLLVPAAVVALLLIARAYLMYRKTREPGQPWWRIFPAILAELRAALRALWAPVRTLTAGLVVRTATVAHTVEARRARGRKRPSDLGPRALIAYFYEQALAAAARIGHRRRPGQTPGEFAGELGERLGAGRGAFNDLTTTFAQARYSPHEPPPDLAERARSSWAAVRESIKAARRGAGR